MRPSKSQLRFFECNIQAWPLVLSSLIPCPPRKTSCGYLCSQRADMTKHIWDVHLRLAGQVAIAGQRRLLDSAQRNEFESGLDQLMVEHILSRSPSGWRIV